MPVGTTISAMSNTWFPSILQHKTLFRVAEGVLWQLAAQGVIKDPDAQPFIGALLERQFSDVLGHTHRGPGCTRLSTLVYPGLYPPLAADIFDSGPKPAQSAQKLANNRPKPSQNRTKTFHKFDKRKNL